MADLKISQLPSLPQNSVDNDDLIPIVHLGETKKVTVEDLLEGGFTQISDGTISSSKVAFQANAITPVAINASAVTTDKIAADAVTAAKLADGSSAVVSANLPAAGDFSGQVHINSSTNKASYWNGSAWVAMKAGGSVNTVLGDTSGIVNIAASASNDSITLTPSLDATSAANQFLAGPTGGGGSPSYRTIDPSDLPIANSSLRGAVVVNGGGLTMSSGAVVINNSVAAQSSPSLVKVAYNAQGLVTSSSSVVGADLPVATSLAPGAVQPGTGLSVSNVGVLNHSNTIVAGTVSGITYDAQGHVTSAVALTDADIPNLPASKLTTGTLATSLLGTKSVTGPKLADYATVKFGGAGSTSGVVTFPTADYAGQQFFDATNGDLYLYDGNTWQPITVISGDLVYAGTYNGATNKVKSVTTQGSAAGLTIGAALPAASAQNLRYYVVVSDSGTGVSPAPAVALAPPDMIISNGATWDLVDVSNAIAGQAASNISVIPYGGIAATNVQTALQELDDEKLRKDGGAVTGELLIGSTGTFGFEGSTENAYETYLSVVDPTADRTITFPDASGTVVLSGAIVNADINASAAIAYSKLALTGSLVNADIAAGAAIADSKLATISSAGKVANSATTAASANTASAIVARDASGNFSAGTISAALTGNASTATALATARTIQGVSFDGSANITVVTAGSGISVTGTAVANTGVLSVNGSTGAVTGLAALATAQTFTAAQRGTVSALTSAATVTPDFAVANNFSLTLGVNLTIANPSNLTAGQSGSIVITQGSGTAYTVAYGSYWKFSGGTPTMSTGLSSVSTLVYYVESATRITAQLLTNVA